MLHQLLPKSSGPLFFLSLLSTASGALVTFEGRAANSDGTYTVFNEQFSGDTGLLSAGEVLVVSDPSYISNGIAFDLSITINSIPGQTGPDDPRLVYTTNQLLDFVPQGASGTQSDSFFDASIRVVVAGSVSDSNLSGSPLMVALNTVEIRDVDSNAQGTNRDFGEVIGVYNAPIPTLGSALEAVGFQNSDPSGGAASFARARRVDDGTGALNWRNVPNLNSDPDYTASYDFGGANVSADGVRLIYGVTGTQLGGLRGIQGAIDVDVSPVPEPSSAMLCLLGFFCVIRRGR